MISVTVTALCCASRTDRERNETEKLENVRLEKIKLEKEKLEIERLEKIKLENEVEINCIDDLFDKRVMQDYRLEVISHQEMRL